MRAPSAAGRSSTTASTTGHTRPTTTARASPRPRLASARRPMSCSRPRERSWRRSGDGIHTPTMRPTGWTTRTSRARSTRRFPSQPRSRASGRGLPVAPGVGCLGRPVLGVVGLLDWRIDTGLLAALADRRPDWSLALVGPALTDLGALAARPNIHVLGRLPYPRLPAVLKG